MIPSSGYRSAAVIQSNPLMSYTGNPSLVPYKSFDADGNYTFIINKAFKMAAYGNVWVVDNRYVYDYQANDTSVLRTIKQPLGGFAQWQYGVQGTGKFFKDNLQVSLSGYMLQGHNGAPYNWNKGRMVVSASAFYYLKDFYFGATYRSPMVYPDGCMIGMWMDTRSNYTLQVGWSNDRWNFRFYTRNPFYGSMVILTPPRAPRKAAITTQSGAYIPAAISDSSKSRPRTHSAMARKLRPVMRRIRQTVHPQAF